MAASSWGRRETAGGRCLQLHSETCPAVTSQAPSASCCNPSDPADHSQPPPSCAGCSPLRFRPAAALLRHVCAGGRVDASRIHPHEAAGHAAVRRPAGNRPALKRSCHTHLFYTCIHPSNRIRSAIGSELQVFLQECGSPLFACTCIACCPAGPATPSAAFRPARRRRRTGDGALAVSACVPVSRSSNSLFRRQLQQR